MPASPYMSQKGAVTTEAWRDDTSAGAYHAHHGDSSRRVTQASSLEIATAYETRAETCALFLAPTLCQTAMAVALFSSCRGPSSALFIVR